MYKPKRVRTLVIYSNNKPDIIIPEDIKVSYANPRFWNGVPRPIHDAIYAPEHPDIEKAHKDAGKVVWRPEGEAEPVVTSAVETSLESSQEPVEAVEEDVVEESTSFVSTERDSNAEDPAEASEPHWSELSWPKMRSLATKFTEDPVKSKDQARDILLDAEAEGKI